MSIEGLVAVVFSGGAAGIAALVRNDLAKARTAFETAIADVRATAADGNVLASTIKTDTQQIITDLKGLVPAVPETPTANPTPDKPKTATRARRK